MAAVVNYSPPWWVNLLHRMPHFNTEFQLVSSDFRPEDSEYQKNEPEVRRRLRKGVERIDDKAGLQSDTRARGVQGQPTEAESILLLGSVALLCLGLDLLFLLFYSFWLCCRRRKSDDSSHSHTHSQQQPSADCCCTAWCVIIATLVCR
ncbi:Protein tweety 3 [Liparis tanakae]|uniref:Protein tweety homolog n=1 Tax=Liparis tanakae TaxID=230148 RepID=A0A4Z2FQX1_9TELE|nr:Protein tweety 3 [Liparis tanakae]